MKLSDQIEAARPSGFWIVSAIAVLVMCLGFITLSGGSWESLKLGVVGLAGSLICLICSVLYTRKELHEAVLRAKALEAQPKREDER